MICDHGDIALVPFPFVDLPTSKRRPALIISSRSFNAQNDHSIFAMITTAKSSTWPSDYMLRSPSDAGLKTQCYVRWKTFTLPNQIIIRRLGKLAAEDQQNITARMKEILMSA
jgi:mRNA interferase MazF